MLEIGFCKNEGKYSKRAGRWKRDGRLSELSLDPENQKKYAARREEWKHVRMRTGNMNSQEYAESKRPLADFRAVPQEQVVNLLRDESQTWIKDLAEKEKQILLVRKN